MGAKVTLDNGLIKSNGVKDALSITPAETKRWIADGRIPTARMESFTKWGQTLHASLHDPLLLGEWKKKVPKWRKQDEKVKKKNRKAASDKAKVTRGHRVALAKRAKLADYPALFPVARKLKRTFTFFMGPTNSGKTFKALEKLTAAKSGVYAAPLRLMASENQERIKLSGTPCSLITGEETTLDPSASHEACTIEMLDTHTVRDVIVIDECQMILDRDRGWAWTQAIVGAPSKDVVLTGSQEALEVIKALVQETGDSLVVHESERLSELCSEVTTIKKKNLSAGDAVICFSRKRIMEVREDLQSSGWTVATIYGSLSPEVRRMESSRFEKGEADILVATDAIGMGLNLPINRIIFADAKKFDGETVRILKDSEFHQIAGRAGRYGLTEKGSVGILGGINFARNQIEHSIRNAPRVRAHSGQFLIMPPLQAFREAGKIFKTDDLIEILTHIQKAFPKNNLWQSAVSQGMWEQASFIEQYGDRFDIETKFRYLMAPVKMRTHEETFFSFVTNHANGRKNHPPKVSKNESLHEGSLKELEYLVHSLDLYVWLARHFPEVYCKETEARDSRSRADQGILKHLKEKALKKLCESCMRPIPKTLNHRMCDECFHERRGYW